MKKVFENFKKHITPASKKTLILVGVGILILSTLSVIGIVGYYSINQRDTAFASGNNDIAVDIHVNNIRSQGHINGYLPNQYLDPLLLPVANNSEIKRFDYYDVYYQVRNEGTTPVLVRDINLSVAETGGIVIPKFNGQWERFTLHEDFAADFEFTDNNRLGTNYQSVLGDPNYVSKYTYLCMIRRDTGFIQFLRDTTINANWFEKFNPRQNAASCAFDTSGNMVFRSPPVHLSNRYVEYLSGTQTAADFVEATIHPGDTFFVAQAFYVPKDVAGPVSLTASASVTGNTDPNPANNSDTVNYFVYRSDLDVSIDRVNSTVGTGQPQTYHVTVTNNGPTLAQAPVTVKSSLLPEFSFDSFNIPNSDWNCTNTGQEIECTYIPGDFPVGTVSEFYFDAILTI